MNENAKKWVAALRSGEFKQGVMYLCSGEKYCCLGVACELAVRDGVEMTRSVDVAGIVQFDEKQSILPLKALEWLGLRDVCGGHCGGHCEQTLSVLNDDGKSFAEIADIIESEPKGLFVEQS